MDTRTNIVLDDKLVAKAMKLAGVKTKKAAIEAALRAYVRKPDYSALLALEGSRLISDDYDPKALYSKPLHEPLVAQEAAPPDLLATSVARKSATRKK